MASPNMDIKYNSPIVKTIINESDVVQCFFGWGVMPNA